MQLPRPAFCTAACLAIPIPRSSLRPGKRFNPQSRITSGKQFHDFSEDPYDNRKPREALKAAQGSGVDEIIVDGELTDKLKNAKRIAMLSGRALAALTAAVGAETMSGRASGGPSISSAYSAFIGGAASSAVNGFETAVIIAAATLGIGLLVALFKDYEEISFERGKMTLNKKSK